MHTTVFLSQFSAATKQELTVCAHSLHSHDRQPPAMSACINNKTQANSLPAAPYMEIQKAFIKNTVLKNESKCPKLTTRTSQLIILHHLPSRSRTLAPSNPWGRTSFAASERARCGRRVAAGDKAKLSGIRSKDLQIFFNLIFVTRLPEKKRPSPIFFPVFFSNGSQESFPF